RRTPPRTAADHPLGPGPLELRKRALARRSQRATVRYGISSSLPRPLTTLQKEKRHILPVIETSWLSRHGPGSSASTVVFRNLPWLRLHLNICMEESTMTAKRILVPLKGTAGDAAVLSVIAPAASRVGATVRLLHVAPVPHNLVSASGRVVMYADQ